MSSDSHTSMVARVARYDVQPALKHKRTPQGGLRLDAFITRTGVLEYKEPDGSIRREYRPAEEVFHGDSLQTAAGAPVTDLHPTQLLDAENWSEHSVGHVGDDVHQDGSFVAARLYLQDVQVVRAVEAGARKEVSCGYTCEVDPTPGETPAGERYDAVQRSIQYNHVAVGPAGWGRAGHEVSLRLDSTGHGLAPAEPKHEDGVMDAKLKELEVGLQKAQERADAAEKATAEHVEALKVAVEAQKAAEEAQATLREDLEAAVSVERLDALVTERQAIIDKARTITSDEYQAAGKSNLQIMRDTCEAAGVKLGDDVNEAYLRGRFDAVDNRPVQDNLDKGGAPPKPQQSPQELLREYNAALSRGDTLRKPGD